MQRRLYLDGARLYRESVPPPPGGGGRSPTSGPSRKRRRRRSACAASRRSAVRRRPGGRRRPAGVLAASTGHGVIRKPSYASYPPLPLGRAPARQHLGRDGPRAGPPGCASLADARAIVLERARPVRAGRGPAGAAIRDRTGGVYWVDATWNRDRGAAVTARPGRAGAPPPRADHARRSPTPSRVGRHPSALPRHSYDGVSLAPRHSWIADGPEAADATTRCSAAASTRPSGSGGRLHRGGHAPPRRRRGQPTWSKPAPRRTPRSPGTARGSTGVARHLRRDLLPQPAQLGA